MISDYASLKQVIKDWFTADEIDPYLDYIIGAAERDLRKDLRIREMESATSGTTASGVLAVPSDYLELKGMRIDGYAPLKRKPWEWIYEKFPTRSVAGGGQPYYVAREAGNFIFGPFPGSDTAISYVYYKAPPFLSATQTTNTFTASAADILTYACLKHAVSFQREDERLGMFAGFYDQEKTRLNDLSEHEEGSGSSIELESDSLAFGGSLGAIGIGRLR